MPCRLGESALPHRICSPVAASDDTWAAVSSVACLLETTWQADILQINEERLSISSGIRHSLKQCVISVPTVSIFSGAENLLWATRVHGRRLRKRRTREIASKRCAFGRAMSANRPGSFLCLHAFLFLLPAGYQLGKLVTYENAYHSFHMDYWVVIFHNL